MLRRSLATWPRRRWIAVIAMAAVLATVFVTMAGVPVATVAGALIAVSNYGPAIIGPALAVAPTLFGLTQRVGDVNRRREADPRP
jgi:hypothetical protein